MPSTVYPSELKYTKRRKRHIFYKRNKQDLDGQKDML